MKKFSLLILFALVSKSAFGTPTITSVSGSIATGNNLTITGSGFGTKSRSMPWTYADFQSSINPTSGLSYNTTWGAIQYQTRTTDSNIRWGSGCSVSNWNYTSTQRASTFQIPVFSGVGYGFKMLFAYWVKSTINYLSFTGGTAQNWKFGMRIWANSFGYPDIIIDNLAQGESAGSIRSSMEDWPLTTGVDRVYSGTATGFPTTTWRRETIIIKLNSALAAEDGTLIEYINNSTAINKTNWRYNNTSRPGFISQPFVQHVIANVNVPTGGNVYYSDIYADDSWNRVEIGDASTFASCTHLEIQPYTSWADGSVTVNARLGTLSGTKYLFVCDNNNNCSAGYMLGASNPVVTRISPTSGTRKGATTVTITGSGFVPTPTVTFGSSSARNVTFVNSTSLTCSAPSGSSYQTVGVTVTNPDTTSGTLSNAYSYTPQTPVFPWR